MTFAHSKLTSMLIARTSKSDWSSFAQTTSGKIVMSCAALQFVPPPSPRLLLVTRRSMAAWIECVPDTGRFGQ
jgi:hypothetical protein